MSEKTNAGSEGKQIGSAFSLAGKSLDIVKNNWQAFAVVNVFTILSALGNAFGANDNATSGGWTYNSSTAGDWGGLSGAQLAGILGFGFLILLLFLVIGAFLYAMNVSLQIKSSSGKKPGVSELFEDGKKYFFRIIGVTIVSGFIITVGFILLVVPGIIALGRLVMSPYYLVDKNLSVMDAIKQSNEKAKGKMSLIYAAIGVTIVISIIASIAGVIPIIGPLIGAGITIGYSLILALRYQQLKKV